MKKLREKKWKRKENLLWEGKLERKIKHFLRNKYTYDFKGNLLFMHRLNGDNLPKNSINLPYKCQLSEQELQAIEDREKKRKEAARRRMFMEKQNNKSKPQSYQLPEKFSKPLIPAKFEYGVNGNYDMINLKSGVSITQNKRMKKSLMNFAESMGKLTKTDYIDKISQIGTLKFTKEDPFSEDKVKF